MWCWSMDVSAVMFQTSYIRSITIDTLPLVVVVVVTLLDREASFAWVGGGHDKAQL